MQLLPAAKREEPVVPVKLEQIKVAPLSPKAETRPKKEVTIQTEAKSPEPDVKTPLSECSKCSGSRAKGMKYVCLQCENLELADSRRQKAREELEASRRHDDSIQKSIEEAQRRQLEQSVAFRQQMNSEMKSALLELSARKARDSEERY